MKYIIIDTANLFFKSRHIASRSSSEWEKVGMALHLTLSGIQSIVRKFGDQNQHVVFALEGRSWRKDFYEPYKRNRQVKQAALTPAERSLDELFWKTYDEFTTFLRGSTNTSVLQCDIAEADDIIARFIHLHPNDDHYIISSDSDFVQLIASNVKQYNSISGHLITLDGYFDERQRPVKDKKTGEYRVLGDPGWHLFEKCMRGDTSDNVFTAYPGVRTKSTKNSVGLLEAYADRNTRGFTWNNLMLQRWTDHNGVEHRVLDCYERNRTLCDLSAQPEEVKNKVDSAIKQGLRREHISNVGIRFMKFCGKYELVKIAESAEHYGRWLNREYQGELL
jgi:5'-3' exonuclease